MCIKPVISIIRTIGLAGCFGFLISLLRATLGLSYSSPIGILANWHIDTLLKLLHLHRFNPRIRYMNNIELVIVDDNAFFLAGIVSW